MTGAARAGGPSSRMRVDLGIVGGVVASVVMGVILMVLSSLGILQVPWYPTISSLFGGPGFGPEAALYGLTEWFVIGVVFGLIFAFAFKTYSVMKGLGIAGIEFVIMAIALAVVSTPQLQGTILSLPLSSALLMLISMAIGLGFWGATVGYLGTRFVR